MHPSTLRRLGLAFRIEWCLRGLAVVLLAGCGPSIRRPCEFDLHVKVLDQIAADAACHALGAVDHNGNTVSDSRHIYGCAPAGEIITNGSADTMGHELMHHVERNCK